LETYQPFDSIRSAGRRVLSAFEIQIWFGHRISEFGLYVFDQNLLTSAPTSF